MIKVKVFVDDKSIVMTARGHAGYGENGKDIVCSAASILAYTLAQDVTDLQAMGKLKKKPGICIEEGDMTVTCKPRKDVLAEVLHSYFLIQKGFLLLAKNFPQYVEINQMLDADSVKSLGR